LFVAKIWQSTKEPKNNILHPKMSQIERKFSATFCATSATSLAQLLDFLSAIFWGDYLPQQVWGNFFTADTLFRDGGLLLLQAG